MSPRSAQESKDARPFQLIVTIINISVVIAFSFTPYIDWAAHLFGLLSGIFLGGVYFFIRTPAKILALVCWICLFSAGIAILYGVPVYDPGLLDYCGRIRATYGSTTPCPW